MSATIITIEDWAAYCAGLGEDRLRPAEPGDFRFDIGERDEDGYCRVLMIDDRGAVASSDYTDLPYEMVEAFRISQRHPYGGPDHDERLHMDAEEIERYYR